MKKFITHPVFLILIFSLLPLWSLVTSGLPVTHDGADHVARIANFYQNLQEGIIVPRWAANLNWGYGHPILMFLYPLPSYIASLFHFGGFSLVDSLKLVFAFSFIASALTMYLWMKTAFGRVAGFVGALLYTFAPYRFVDLYVRGALGEHVAFVFPPLVLYFLYKLSELAKGTRQKIFYTIGLSMSLAALVLSHNAIAIMFLPVFVLYGIYLFFFETRQKGKFVVHAILSGAFGFGLPAFFWIPAFFEGKYTLRDIVTSGEALERFVPWTWFFVSPWNYGGGDQITKALGFVQWLGVVITAWLIIRSRSKKVRIFLAMTSVVLIASFFIMTNWSKPIWVNLTILQNFQFPWRFLSVSVFAAAALGGVAIGETYKNVKYPKALVCIVCLLAVILSGHMWFPKAYQNRPESFYAGIYPSTTDTGESSPIWSIRFMEHTPAAPMEVISGDATIKPIKRTATWHEYDLTVSSQARIVENTLYFPGWKVYVDDVEVDVQFQDPSFRGLLTFNVTEGSHRVRVGFEDTKLRRVANSLSLGSFIVLISILVGGVVWKKTK